MKPIILAVEQAKTALIDAVNGAIRDGVPCYFLEPIVSDILVQLRNGKDMELAKAKEMEKEEEKNGDGNSI